MTTSRRSFVKQLVVAAGAGAAVTGMIARAPGRADAGQAAVVPGRCRVIVNADDFGMSEPVDAGIVEAHDHGIVTSASLMVDGAHAAAAVAQAGQRAELGLGIHVAFDDRGRWLVDMRDRGAVRRELDRQLDAFVRMVGRPPTHIDSHHHAHRRFNVAWLFLEAGERYAVPVRGFSEVQFLGSFYGQPVFGQTDLSRISVEALVALLRSVEPGVSEVSCHPGHVEPRADARYNREREVELRTLLDPRVRAAVDEREIALINYTAYRPPVGRDRRTAMLPCGTAAARRRTR